VTKYDRKPQNLPPLSPLGWSMKVYSPAVVGVAQKTVSPT
jgi:hypothetical protein